MADLACNETIGKGLSESLEKRQTEGKLLSRNDCNSVRIGNTPLQKTVNVALG